MRSKIIHARRRMKNDCDARQMGIVVIYTQGTTGPMRGRPDLAEAVRIKNRLRRKAEDEHFKIHPSLSVRQRGSQPFCPAVQEPERNSATEHGETRSRHRPDPITGWIYFLHPHRQARHGGAHGGPPPAGQIGEQSNSVQRDSLADNGDSRVSAWGC